MYHYTKLGVLFKNMFTLFISMCVRLYTCVYMCVGNVYLAHVEAFVALGLFRESPV